MLGYCFCVLKDYRGSGVQTDRVELYIDDLCVDETCRGQHLGTLLYEAVLALARERGFGDVTLTTNRPDAIHVYEKAGLRHLSDKYFLEL